MAFPRFTDSLNPHILDGVDLRDDEERLNDGSIVCKKCGTARYLIEIDGRPVTSPLPVMCRCLEDQARREASAESDRLFREKVERIRGDAFTSKTFHKMTFAESDGKDARLFGAMKRYVERFEEFRADGRGLLLYGHVGTGKTFAAACVANALIDDGYSVKFTSLSRMINAVMGTFDGKQQIIDGLADHDLVVIDDLGAERTTQAVADYAFQIIDGLYQARVPMICTTNLSLDEMKDPQSYEQRRIYDRIFEACFPIRMSGENKRKTNIINSYDQVKDMLGL